MDRICSNCHGSGHNRSRCTYMRCGGSQFCGIPHPKTRKDIFGGFSSAPGRVAIVKKLRKIVNKGMFNTTPTTNFPITDSATVGLFYNTINDLNPERNASEIIGVILRCAVNFLNTKYGINLSVEREEPMILKLSTGKYLQGPVDFLVHLHDGCCDGDDKIVLIVEIKTNEAFNKPSSIAQLQCQLIAGWDKNCDNQSSLLYDYNDFDELENNEDEPAELIAKELVNYEGVGSTKLQPIHGVLVSLEKIITMYCNETSIGRYNNTINLPSDKDSNTAMMFDVFVRSIVSYIRPYLNSYIGALPIEWDDNHNP